jgi:hypothetical protein
MSLSETPLFVKSRVRFFFLFTFIALAALFVFFLLQEKTPTKIGSGEQMVVFNCPKGAPLSVNDKSEWGFGVDFPCYTNYYRLLVSKNGAPVAILDLKNRTKNDLYLEQRCHELSHVIGRGALEDAGSPAEAFALGDAFCANGYYHGIMQELLQKQGRGNLTPEFLNKLCVSYIPGKILSPIDHVNCSHGIGHGIMYANGNEVFEALKTCDLLRNGAEREPCWGGVFMENLLTDFSQHKTKYVNQKDLLFPCTVVENKYKNACYTYQSSYVFKTTKSFKETFAVCRESPKQYRDVCFRGIGGNVATMAGWSNVGFIKNVCVSVATSENEQKNCVVGAIASIVFIRGSAEDGQLLCSVLPENLQSSCSDSATTYYRLFHNEEK